MKKPRIFVFSLLIMFCLVTVQAWKFQHVGAGENTWTSIIDGESGPALGNPQNLAFFPNYATAPKIFVGSESGWIYLGTLSADGWSWEESYQAVSRIAVLKTAPDNLTVFAVSYTGQVYKSIDGGKNWSPLSLNGVSSGGGIYDIAISPEYLNDWTVFLACTSGVFRSIDGGENWTKVFSSGGYPVEILAISPSYKTDKTIFAVGSSVSINRSQNGGDSWQGMYNLPYMTYVTDIGISPNYATDQTLFAQLEGQSKGLFKSTDQGGSWALVSDADYHKLAISPNYANDGLVICYDQTQPSFLIVNEKLGGAWHSDKPQSGPDLGLNFFAFVPNFAANKTVFAGVTQGGLYSFTAVIYDPFSTPLNKPPQANAGLNQTVPINVPVTLNGGGSTDPEENYPLNYQWEIVSSPNWPAQNPPPLQNPNNVSPTFIPNDYGQYVVKLVVTDDAGASSLPAYVTISTVRSDPKADAGPDQVFTILNQMIELDGSKSYDYDNDLTSYEWTIIKKPQDSNVILSGDNSANPTFAPDIYGDYIFQLVVRDSAGGASQPDTVKVSCNNVPPIAEIFIGITAPGIPGQIVFVSGRNSSDPNEDKITYRWSFSSVPERSRVTFADPEAMETQFIPDKAGTYVVNLVVNDRFLNSDPASRIVIIISAETAVTPVIRNLQNTILGTDHSCFRNNNTNLRDALYDKLNAVINCLEANNVNGALAQLQQDFLGKVDGSNNSWFLPGQEQQKFYQEVLSLIAMLQSAS